MGLAGASKKQRIQDDPRNTRWAQDTSAPGFRLLASMGWNPDSAPTLGNAQSQAAIIANGGSVFSKRIASIPIAKDDTCGIGMKRGSAAATTGTLKAIGVAPASGANSTAMVSGFVTAGSITPQNGITGRGNDGGEFGSLLARLNKLKEQNGTLSASASPAPESEPKKRKRSSSASSSSSVSSDSSDSDSDDEPTPSTSTLAASASPAPPAPLAPTAAALAILKNPRMAARSKHLRAKRMATASNASAMAEILGLAPSASATPSPAPSGASTPVPVLAVNGPRADGWPAVPPRGSSAIAVSETITTKMTTTTVSAAGVGAAPMFASAASTSLAATFEPAAAPAAPTDSKAARRAAKALRRADKEARRAAKAEERAQREIRARSPSPEFKVHSAAHDPFRVGAETPTAVAPPAASLGSVFGRMFVGAASGGMGATFVPPTVAVPTAESGQEGDGVVDSAGKKDRGDKKRKKAKAAEDAAAKENAERPSKKERRSKSEDGARDGESKAERRACKEAKRAKKEAKRAKAE